MANITKVYLLNVPIENNYKNTLYFSSRQAQQSYFQSRIIASYNFNDFTYQRKDKVIRVPEQYDNIYNCNYVMYQNSAYSNKWFYAFVTKLEYINDGRTDIYIETDVIQTWLFDYTVNPSFVQREHTNDDTIGKNTLPENLELGEYICNNMVRDDQMSDYCYIVQSAEKIGASGGSSTSKHTNFGGVEAPGYAYICENATLLATVIATADSEGHGDAISNVYMVPKIICDFDFDQQVQNLRFNQDDPMFHTVSISKPEYINIDYLPRNKKLLTFPYQYLVLDNNNGTSNILHYEFFSNPNGKCEFSIAGVPVPGGSIKCCPKIYKNIGINQSEGIMAGKFPICGWVNDTYTNWLTQNAVNIGIGIATNSIQAIGSLATGNIVGALGGAMGVANVMAEQYQHSLLPDSSRGNTNGGDINTCYNTNTFHFYQMSIKGEYAKCIDDYFDMFGYATNRVKVPNKNHRQNYWYTKTINANINGAIPQDDLNKIRSCYDNGITFWKDPSNVENYSVSNAIV